VVFRAFAGASALPVGGGGRYDSLFRRLGAEAPAVGFSLSVERLLEAGQVEAR
jgi:histidyl-tRNA synthetase